MEFSCYSALYSWVRWPQHRALLDALDGNARFVGGAVRDTLQGKKPKDFDLATPFTPDEVTQRLEGKGIKVLPTGLAHGTVSAILKGQAYEITTLRQDVHTDGRHACVAFTDSWAQDAQRRDFTMNALYVDGRGMVYDFVGTGLEDALGHHVRFIGDPSCRIQEDYLRILRFFRFSAWYGAGLDATSLDACAREKKGLLTLSKERITQESLRLLEAPWPWDSVLAMIRTGIWSTLLDGHNMECAASFAKMIHHVEAQLGKKALGRALWQQHRPFWRLGLLCAHMSAPSNSFEDPPVNPHVPGQNLILGNLENPLPNTSRVPFDGRRVFRLSNKNALWLRPQILPWDISWDALVHQVCTRGWQATFFSLVITISMKIKAHDTDSREKNPQEVFLSQRQGSCKRHPSLASFWHLVRRLWRQRQRFHCPIKGASLVNYGWQGKSLGQALESITFWWILQKTRKKNAALSRRAIRKALKNKNIVPVSKV